MNHFLLLLWAMGERGPGRYGYSVPTHQTISFKGISKIGEGGGTGRLRFAVTAARRTKLLITSHVKMPRDTCSPASSLKFLPSTLSSSEAILVYVGSTISPSRMSMSEMHATMLSVQNTGDGWCRTIFGAAPATPQLATMELGADWVSEGSTGCQKDRFSGCL